MFQPINRTRCNLLFAKYLSARLSPSRILSLKSLTNQLFLQLTHDLDQAIMCYNNFPNCLQGSQLVSDLFVNTLHLKSIFSDPLPSFTTVLTHLENHPTGLEIVFSEMRDSTYFHHIYEIDKPEHLLANLLTLVYRCHLLSSYPTLREQKAQISSTLEEMSALRQLFGEDSLHHRATRHWILDWEGEGFSQELARITTT